MYMDNGIYFVHIMSFFSSFVLILKVKYLVKLSAFEIDVRYNLIN